MRAANVRAQPRETLGWLSLKKKTGAGDRHAHTLGDNLGWSLAITHMNADGLNDLLIGAQSGGIPVGKIQAGAIYIIRGGTIPWVLDMAGDVGPRADITIWVANDNLLVLRSG